MLPVHCDVTQEADVEAMIAGRGRGVRPRSTRCSTWPGIADAAMLADVTMEHYDKLMDVDLRGVLLGMKHGIRAMLEAGDGGAIVNWSSIGGLNASPFTSVYSAAKAGVISFTKSAAVEYGAQGDPRQLHLPRLHPHRDMSANSRGHARHAREGGAEPRRPAGGGRRGRARSSRRTAPRSSAGAIIPVDGGWAAKLA